MPTQLTPMRLIGLAVIVYLVGVGLNTLAYTSTGSLNTRNETIADTSIVVAVLLVIAALGMWVLRPREDQPPA